MEKRSKQIKIIDRLITIKENIIRIVIKENIIRRIILG